MWHRKTIKMWVKVANFVEFDEADGKMTTQEKVAKGGIYLCGWLNWKVVGWLVERMDGDGGWYAGAKAMVSVGNVGNG